MEHFATNDNDSCNLANNGILGNNNDNDLGWNSIGLDYYHNHNSDDFSANWQRISDIDGRVHSDGFDSDWVTGESTQKDLEFSEQLRFSDDSIFRLPEYYDEIATDLSTQSTATDPFQGFIEAQKLFEAQAKQEYLASQIVEMANNLQIQNEQNEISQKAQEKMFAYLMQFSQSPNNGMPNESNQVSDFTAISTQPTALEVFHQDLQNSSERQQALEELTTYFEDSGKAEQNQFGHNSYSTFEIEADDEDYDLDEIDEEDLEYNEGQVLSFF